jgi:hypothetical protein
MCLLASCLFLCLLLFLQAMFRDRKLNPMQHSVGKLQELLEAYNFWRPQDKHAFRVPNKPPKRALLRGVRTG